MSRDGGDEEEFDRYWASNSRPRRFAGGWVEYCSHPQVNAEPFWYNEDSGTISWQPPGTREEPCRGAADGLPGLSGQGPAWDMGIRELKQALSDGRAPAHAGELARRAASEYEAFLPRVLSWHDYQHITFWFFGGMQRNRAAQGKSFKRKGAGRELFADDAFFKAAAETILARMGRMHPINLTYFVWTFARAGIVVPGLMDAVGDHLCEGRLPLLDRCSLGTILWNFSRLRARHDWLFETAAIELSRSNRIRSLAPRNIQNIVIAYGQSKCWNEPLFISLARGMVRLLDHHDPVSPKLDRKLLFSYTCRDGSEVRADSFRINGLGVILANLRRLGVSGESMGACIASMADYVWRSIERSPKAFREPGDACVFARELVCISRDAPELGITHLLPPVCARFQELCEGATDRQRRELESALRDVGMPPKL